MTEALRTPTAAERAEANIGQAAADSAEFSGFNWSQKHLAARPQLDHCKDWALDGLKYPEQPSEFHAEALLDLLARRPVAGAFWAAEAMSEASDTDHLALLRCISAGDSCAAGVIVGRMLKQYARSCLETRLLEVE
jgi:hypothetical protein